MQLSIEKTGEKIGSLADEMHAQGKMGMLKGHFQTEWLRKSMTSILAFAFLGLVFSACSGNQDGKGGDGILAGDTVDDSTTGPSFPSGDSQNGDEEDGGSQDPSDASQGGQDLDVEDDADDLIGEEDLEEPEECDSPYVYLDPEGRRFMYKGEPFVPISVNYNAEVRRSLDGEYFVAPHSHYCEDTQCCHDKESCELALKEQFEQIRELGFNSIRMVGLVARTNEDDDQLYIDCAEYMDWGLYYCSPESRIVMTPTPNPLGFELIRKAIETAEEADLKVVFLAGGKHIDAPIASELYRDYLRELAAEFRDSPTIFAYDLDNEPVYSALNTSIKKEDAHRLARKWYDAIRESTPYAMVTMGVAEMGTIRHWDPGLMPLDFASYHIYGSEWFDTGDRRHFTQMFSFLNKEPYLSMVGETGLPSQPGIVSEETQHRFAQFTLDLAWACGQMGYQWWQYGDVRWSSTEMYENYFGLVDRQGRVKEAVEAFSYFVPTFPRPECPEPEYMGNFEREVVRVKGRLVTVDGEGIPNGFVQGQRIGTGGSAWTLTDSDGNFSLRSDQMISRLTVTAAGYALKENMLLGVLDDVGDIVLKKPRLDTSISPPTSCPE